MNRTSGKCGALKHTSICMMGEPEEEERKKEKVFEAIMAEKFPNLLKNITPSGSSVSSK